MAVDVDNQSTLDVQSVGVSLWQARQFTVEPPPRDPLELFLEFRDERRVSQEQRLEGARAHTSVQGSLARWAAARVQVCWSCEAPPQRAAGSGRVVRRRQVALLYWSA